MSSFDYLWLFQVSTRTHLHSVFIFEADVSMLAVDIERSSREVFGKVSVSKQDILQMSMSKVNLYSAFS